MFGGSKLKLKDSILKKIEVAAQILGCSPTEFAEKVLNEEADKVINSTGSKEVSAAEVEDIANKLKGLGYLE